MRSFIWTVVVFMILIHDAMLELIALAGAELGRGLLHAHIVAGISVCLHLFV